jgi:hypothetical protein
MTHDELITYIDESTDGLKHKHLFEKLLANTKALRAVVELHKPQDITLPDGSWGENCCVCNNGWAYPCPTIQAIEEELK